MLGPCRRSAYVDGCSLQDERNGEQDEWNGGVELRRDRRRSNRVSRVLRRLLRAVARSALPSLVARDPKPIRGRGSHARSVRSCPGAMGSGFRDGRPSCVPVPDRDEHVPYALRAGAPRGEEDDEDRALRRCDHSDRRTRRGRSGTRGCVSASTGGDRPYRPPRIPFRAGGSDARDPSVHASDAYVSRTRSLEGDDVP